MRGVQQKAKWCNRQKHESRTAPVTSTRRSLLMRINVAADMQKKEAERGKCVCVCVYGGVLELNLSSHGAAIYSNLFAWP